jgi:hypothetical protein
MTHKPTTTNILLCGDYSPTLHEYIAGEQFSLARPALSEDAEAEVREIVREILEEEG